MDISIIIINYNTKKLTEQTVEAVISGTKNLDYEIIVVDNSTCNEEKYISESNERVKAINIDNKGFGNGCNLGTKIAEGQYLLFLNSDTIVDDGAIERAFRFIESNSRIGALGIHTVLKDGSLDSGCKRGFPTPSASLYYFLGLDKKYPESRKYGVYHQTFIDENETAEVDCISGAFMLMPAELFFELGGFDEAYFMHCEDIDLCYRIKQAGYKIIYFAESNMIHLKGQSSLRSNSKFVTENLYKSMEIFYNKFYREKYSSLTNMIVKIGIRTKYYLSVLRTTFSNRMIK